MAPSNSTPPAELKRVNSSRLTNVAEKKARNNEEDDAAQSNFNATVPPTTPQPPAATPQATPAPKIPQSGVPITAPNTRTSASWLLC